MNYNNSKIKQYLKGVVTDQSKKIESKYYEKNSVNKYF